MTTILFAAKYERWDQYEAPLRHALADVGLADATLTLDAAPETVDYIVYAPNSGLSDFTPYTRLKAVLNLWAGVEDVVGNKTLKVPLARMVDDGLTEGMREWVTGHVLRHHLGLDAHIHGQDGVWRVGIVPPLARDRTVAILGLGVLGEACARAMSGLGFHTLGWSRNPKDIPGVTTFHGAKGLRDTLEQAEIAVLLLPNTAATENTLNTDTLALMPRGAVIINPGRGPLIDDDALLAALDTGQIAHATLDVFRVEPLPV
ncbi:MAG: NAD(P)-dependent oxidoreductase, partial [Roseicyclus sp.]